MDRLEEQAAYKEREFDDLSKIVSLEFKEGTLTESQLSQALKKSFMLGHNAGHCRGERYLSGLRKHQRELTHYE